MTLRLTFAIAWLICAASMACATDLSQGLPLPAVPDSLRTPTARADYAIEHFWDEMDFANAKYSTNETFMEQTFANYAMILGLATPGPQLQACVDSLLAKASVNKDALRLLCSLAATYLYEPESPMANDRLYLYFVEAQLQSPDTPEVEQQRLQYQKQTIMMNRPGTPPADFTFAGRDGAEHRLSEAIAGRRTLLMFYSPDCGDCHRAMADIKANESLRRMISDGSLQVLAIADADEPELWQKHAGRVPDCIIDVLDTTGIVDQELYDIPYTPTFMLIGADGKVLLKNRPLREIISALN